jgi:hypothetical protein
MEDPVTEAEIERRKRISLRNQMKKASGRRARNPCSERSKDKCMRECVWTDYTIWWFGKEGKCEDNDLFSQYISVICHEDLLDKAVDKQEIKNIAKMFGYTASDFDETAWKNVTKRQLCERVSSDAERIKNFLQKTDKPWVDLGMSKETYDDLVNYAALQYAEGKSFYGIIDSLSKYINRNNIKTAAKVVFVVLVIVLAVVAVVPYMYPDQESVGTEGEIARYRTRHGIDVRTMETGPILAAAAEAEAVGQPSKYLEPGVTYNSILDLATPYGPMAFEDVTIKKLSTGTNVGELEEAIRDISELSGDYCDIGLTMEREYLESTIAAVEESPYDPKNFEDLKKWGMLPGQQIYYGGAFGVQDLTHHGVYVGDGVVLEVGQGPQQCKKVARNTLGFKDQMTGLSTLTNFAKRAEKQGSPIYILTTPEDSDRETIVRRLERAQEVIGCTDYNILLTNCQHIANYITFGVRASLQSAVVFQGAQWIAIGGGALAALIGGWMKLKRQLVDKVLLRK